MNQDEIIEMSAKSGMDLYGLGRVRVQFLERLEAFAELAFEKGRQQGMKQENALWKLAETSKDIGYDK